MKNLQETNLFCFILLEASIALVLTNRINELDRGQEKAIRLPPARILPSDVGDAHEDFVHNNVFGTKSEENEQLLSSETLSNPYRQRTDSLQGRLRSGPSALAGIRRLLSWITIQPGVARDTSGDGMRRVLLSSERNRTGNLSFSNFNERVVAQPLVAEVEEPSDDRSPTPEKSGQHTTELEVETPEASPTGTGEVAVTSVPSGTVSPGQQTLTPIAADTPVEFIATEPPSSGVTSPRQETTTVPGQVSESPTPLGNTSSSTQTASPSPATTEGAEPAPDVPTSGSPEFPWQSNTATPTFTEQSTLEASGWSVTSAEPSQTPGQGLSNTAESPELLTSEPTATPEPTPGISPEDSELRHRGRPTKAAGPPLTPPADPPLPPAKGRDNRKEFVEDVGSTVAGGVVFFCILIVVACKCCQRAPPPPGGEEKKSIEMGAAALASLRPGPDVPYAARARAQRSLRGGDDVERQPLTEWNETWSDEHSDWDDMESPARSPPLSITGGEGSSPRPAAEPLPPPIRASSAGFPRGSSSATPSPGAAVLQARSPSLQEPTQRARSPRQLPPPEWDVDW